MATADAELDHDAAYGEYVTAKIPWLRWTAFLLCQDWHRADDLLQTTAAKLYAAWPRARRMENLDGYTRKILVNAFLAEQRSHWWKRVTVQDEIEDAPESQSDVDAALDLRAALLTLTAKQRTVLVLRYYDDLSVDETADVLHCSTGNVKKQTSVALAALRKKLGAPDEDEQAPGTARTRDRVGFDPMVLAQDRSGGVER